MGCHTGGVIDNNGKLIRMVGSPTPQMMFTIATQATINNPDFTAANIQIAIMAKPPGWFYNFDPDYLEQEIKERELYESTTLTEFFYAADICSVKYREENSGGDDRKIQV